MAETKRAAAKASARAAIIERAGVADVPEHTGPIPPTPYRCVTCDERFPTYGAKIERHMGQQRHHRVEAIL